MVKKYFALSVIAASVALAACSSDDDDDEDDGGTDPVVTTVDGSGFDSVDATSDLGVLLSDDAYADIVATLDAPDTTYTLFAPSDAAFTAYEDMVAASLADTDDSIEDLAALDELADGVLDRILLNHVVLGQIDTTATDEPSYATLAEVDAADADSAAQMLQLSADGLSIAVSTGADADVLLGTVAFGAETGADGVALADSEQDAVYPIDEFLIPGDVSLLLADQTDPVDPGDPGDGGTAGALSTLLAGETASYTNAVAAVDAAYGSVFDTAVWTLFLPDDTLATGAVSEATIVGHISSTAYDGSATGLEAQIGSNILNAGSTTEGTGVAYAAGEIAVAGASGAITVGGHAVTYIGQITADGGTTLGAHVYSIAGVLTDAVAQ